MYNDIESLEILGENKENDFTSILTEENDAENNAKLVDRLRQKLLNRSEPEPEPLVVYLVGERGMGKTTIARELFDDPIVRERFNAFAWVPIRRQFKMKEVLRVLVQQLSPEVNTRRMNKVSELMDKVFSALENRSYLVVVDGIGDDKDCECVRFALPLTKSAIIFTTSASGSNRFSMGAHHQYIVSGLYQPDLLNLLNKEANFQPGSEEVGKAIHEISGGSPLFATILGKSLEAEVASAGTEHQYLLDELSTYLPSKGKPQVLGASYSRLAPELKNCLLYMSQFPPGQDIDVEVLCQLLAAEDLIRSSKKLVLDELARLKLIQVQEDMVLTRNGLYKFCRLHHHVRQFCMFKGAEEKFFDVVDFQGTKQVAGLYTRRLAVYLPGNYGGGKGSLGFEGRNTDVKNMATLLIFDAVDEGKSEWPPYINDLTELSSSLRVLNFDRVDFSEVRKFPRGLDGLLLLKYLCFRGCFLEELPSSLRNLKMLETLDLLVKDECNMIIPNDLFKDMTRMVHLYFPRKYRRLDEQGPKLRLDGMFRLKLLINFDMETCEAECLYGMHILILSIITTGSRHELQGVAKFANEREYYLQYFSIDVRSFHCYDKDSVLAMTELLRCRCIDSISIEGPLRDLLEINYNGRVAEMILRGSRIELDSMGYFKRFWNLRSLVLADHAYVGTHIYIDSSLFPCLRSLKLQNLQNLETITIDGAMLLLFSLQIESCNLIELTIPEELFRRLQKIGGDAYSVVPPPSNLKLSWNYNSRSYFL